MSRLAARDDRERRGLRRALAIHKGGDPAGALALYDAHLTAAPDDPDGWRLSGCALRALGRTEEALARLRRAAALAPGDAEAWASLGHVQAERDDTADALACFERALAIAPLHVEALYGRANARRRLARLDEARSDYERVLELDPGHARARHNLGNLLVAIGDAAPGRAHLRAVAAAHPGWTEPRYNLALAHLAAGDLGLGLPAYGVRWSVPGFPSPRRHAELPAWDGRALRGRRLVVHAEQGLGDTIQFARFVPCLDGFGGEIRLEVPGRLCRLLGSLRGRAEIVAHDASVPAADLQVALLDLPARLAITEGSFTPVLPYLRPERERVAAWAARLRADDRRIVAVIWRGNPSSPAERGRSLPAPELLRPLGSLPGIRLVALAEPGTVDLVPHAGPTGWRVDVAGLTLEHPGPDLDAEAAFVDSAAILASCRALATTDTAMAHVAGACGADVHLMLGSEPDWRWRTPGERSPWYPTMRLWRQRTRGDWPELVERVASALDA